MTKEQVQEQIAKTKYGTMEDFYEYIKNETVGFNEDGTDNFYEDDVERYIINVSRKR